MALNGGIPPRVDHTPYLDGLLAEVAELAQRIADAPVDARQRVAAAQREVAVRATMALDGADADGLPAIAEARLRVAEHLGTSLDATSDGSGPADVDSAPAERPVGPVGTWLHAFGVSEDPPDELVQAHEVLGAAAGIDATDLHLTGPGALDAIRELHRRVTAGLVAPDRAGADRTTAQAVHEASIGKILYLTCEPERLGDELAALDAWLQDIAPSTDPVVVAAVLHGELLRLHPFDAANGRVARLAARLVLRHHGVDPDGLAAFEVALARDPLGYHEEVAGSLRRRDWTRWVERCTEALAEALGDAGRALGLSDAGVPDAVQPLLDGSARFTLADVLELVDRDRDAATKHLAALLHAGQIRRVLGSHGLRFELTTVNG